MHTATSRERSIHELGEQARLDTSKDSAQYGTARTLKTFFAHHLANISAALVDTDVQELCLTGKAASYRLTIGLGGYSAAPA